MNILELFSLILLNCHLLKDIWLVPSHTDSGSRCCNSKQLSSGTVEPCSQLKSREIRLLLNEVGNIPLLATYDRNIIPEPIINVFIKLNVSIFSSPPP